MSREDAVTRRIRKQYGRLVEAEWNRLVMDPFHNLEYDTTREFLKRYLPKKGLVLDAGGGPGRYSINLAKAGYDVVLLDPVPEHLAFARTQAEKAGILERFTGIVEGTITDLSGFPDATFDAVLCLGGPLSHVHPPGLRPKAISELVRVARPGAPILASVMSRFGVLLLAADICPQEIAMRKHFERIVFEGDDYRWRRNGYCHFFTADELDRAFRRAGALVVEKVGLEGLSARGDAITRMAKEYPRAWRNWKAVHRRIRTDPFVVDASCHMLIVARKPGRRTRRG